MNDTPTTPTTADEALAEIDAAYATGAITRAEYDQALKNLETSFLAPDTREALQ